MKVLLYSLFAAGVLQASPITVIDLGGFGGPTSVAYRINSGGMIVGWAQTSTGSNFAYTSTGSGNPTALVLPTGATDTYANGINAAGTVAGTSYINGEAHGTVWNAGAYTDLGAGSFALDVNSSGQVVGGNGAGFVFQNGKFLSTGNLAGGNWSSGYAINDSGTVAGYGNTAGGAFHAFSWSAGSGILDLGTLGGANSYATAINNLGQIVGHSATANGTEHAFISTTTGLKDLGSLGGQSYAYGINTYGAVVGYSWTLTGAEHAFLYAGGLMQDLNSLIPAGTGWVLQQAYGIDNTGNIVGVGTLNGQSRAFLIDPLPTAGPSTSTIPEPGTLALLGSGFAGIVGLIRRRKSGKGDQPSSMA